MINQIKTLSDKYQFDKVFNRFFINSSLTLNLKERILPARFLGYTDGKAGFRIPDIKNVPDESIIEFKNEAYTIYLYMKYIEKQEDDVFIFTPLKFQFLSQTRNDDRISVGDDGGKKLVFVTNVISDFLINNSLSQRLQKIDKIKDDILADMEKAFESIKIYFLNEGITDPRMKFFIREKSPLYIFDVNSPDKTKNKQVFQDYMKNIYATDYLLKHRGFISEISVPFLYQTKLPYGYIQINSRTPFPEATFSTVKKYSIQVDDMFKRDNVFAKADEKFIVSNFSKQGFGIVFSDKKYIRYFKEGSSLYLDMNFPDREKASILATVKHISYSAKYIAIGFIIDEIDALSEVNYDNFLATITPNKV